MSVCLSLGLSASYLGRQLVICDHESRALGRQEHHSLLKLPTKSTQKLRRVLKTAPITPSPRVMLCLATNCMDRSNDAGDESIQTGRYKPGSTVHMLRLPACHFAMVSTIPIQQRHEIYLCLQAREGVCISDACSWYPHRAPAVALRSCPERPASMPSFSAHIRSYAVRVVVSEVR